MGTTRIHTNDLAQAVPGSMPGAGGSDPSLFGTTHHTSIVTVEEIAQSNSPPHSFMIHLPYALQSSAHGASAPPVPQASTAEYLERRGVRAALREAVASVFRTVHWPYYGLFY